MTSSTRDTAKASVGQQNNMDDTVLEEATRMMDINAGNSTDLHPATLSGASSNPELRLMGMPKEIREAILKYLLVKDDSIWVRFTVHIHAAQMRDAPDPEHSVMELGPMVVGPKRITSIVRVNKRTAQEATDILYGANLFASNQLHGFNWVFVKDPRCGIGSTNAAKIKTAQFAIPMDTITGPKTYAHQSLLDCLCADLIKLKILTLKAVILTNRWAPRDIIEKQLVKGIRPTLLIAARVTKFHPTLRKAVWRRWSGTKVADKGGRRPGIGKGIDYVWAEIYVDVVPEGLEAVLEGSIAKKDAFGHEMEHKDMVIDSRLVRQTSWDDTEAWLDVRKFALPSDVISSEVDAKEVEMWPGLGQYPV
ncbi:hypothetical protein LTS07_004206 [Exophiala sideris]|uniref:Uncharacterized protein n=1 Tax=Exophiala sideris TaxID=1016849 RepID=A0ABR0JEI4_9EURO|nr:hypothetical protein LTS07_004206 [Exophiala sideris]KAK5062320.1 hypothetical protein LTR69_004678 [Exophiala sideris]